MFLCTRPTDLTPKNVFLFDKALKNKKILIIIPTYENINKFTYESDKQNQCQISFFYRVFFDPQRLFIMFLHEIVLSKKVLVLLPCEFLKLLEDFEFYPISYREMVRRFIFLMEKNLLLQNKSRKEVKTQEFYKPIGVLMKFFGDMAYD